MSELQIFNNSTDSLTDTLTVVDDTLLQLSNYQWDTLRLEYVQTGFEGLPLINSMYTSPWIFAGLLVMMFLPILVFYRANSFLKSSFSMIFKEKYHQNVSRSFHTVTAAELVLMSIFFVISLSLYIYCFAFPCTADLSYIKLGWICGITIAFFLIKILINCFLAYVFFDKTVVRSATVNYLNVLSVCGLFIFPLLILRIYSIPELYFYFDIAGIIILIISILFVSLKLFRLFFSKLIDLFYILLYLCTLEILPFFVLFRIYQSIV